MVRQIQYRGGGGEGGQTTNWGGGGFEKLIRGVGRKHDWEGSSIGKAKGWLTGELGLSEIQPKGGGKL